MQHRELKTKKNTRRKIFWVDLMLLCGFWTGFRPSEYQGFGRKCLSPAQENFSKLPRRNTKLPKWQSLTAMMSLFMCWVWTNFTQYCGTSIIDFKQVNTCWVICWMKTSDVIGVFRTHSKISNGAFFAKKN